MFSARPGLNDEAAQECRSRRVQLHDAAATLYAFESSRFRHLAGRNSCCWRARGLVAGGRIFSARMAKTGLLDRIKNREGALSRQDQAPDFKDLAKRLTAYGAVVFAEFALGGKDSVVPGTGLSVEDFVEKVLLEYATGKIKHHPSRGALITILGTAMRNDIIDALRKKSHEREEMRSVVSVHDDGDDRNHEKPALDDYRQQVFPAPDAGLQEDDYRQRVRTAVQDEPELKELAEAVIDLELYKPEEIAEAVGTSAAEIQNRKKRLRRRVTKHGLVTCRRKEAEEI